jgi:hypothetical protein
LASSPGKTRSKQTTNNQQMPKITPVGLVPHRRTLATVLLGVGLTVWFAVFGFSLTLNHATPVKAAAASTINFQARLLAASGVVVPDGYYHVEFKLYDASSSAGSTQGSCSGDSHCMWTENYTGASTAARVRVVNGYLTANLGTNVAFGTNIHWGEDLWMTMNIGGNGSSASWDGEMTPRLKLTAVPYAFQAGQLTNLTGSNTSTLGFATQTGARTVLVPDESGTLCIQASTNCGFATSSGSTAYIQNQSASAQTGNFFIQSSGASNIGGIIEGAASQTANLFQLQDSAGNVGAAFNSGGSTLTLGRIASSGTVPQGKVKFSDGTTDNFGLTLQADVQTANRTVKIPDSNASTDVVCLYTLANCTGTGGGIAGAGTQNRLSFFDTLGGNHIADSYLLQSGGALALDAGKNFVVNTNTLFVDATNSFVGINNATPGNPLSVNALTTSDSTAAAAVSTGGTTKKGLVVQGVASQTAHLLEFQDSSGNINSSFSQNGSQLTLGRIAGSGTVTQGKLLFADGTTDNFSLTFQSGTLTSNETISVPGNAGGSDTVCLYTLSNCTGTGGGIAGAGTQYRLAYFDTAGGNHITDSQLVQGAGGLILDAGKSLTVVGSASTDLTIAQQPRTPPWLVVPLVCLP